MIKTKKGAVKIRGDIVSVLADLTIILKAAREALIETGMSEEKADRLIEKQLRLSRMTYEETEAEHNEQLREAADKLAEILRGPKLVYGSEKKSEEAGV